jgi:hypothetical protein
MGGGAVDPAPTHARRERERERERERDRGREGERARDHLVVSRTWIRGARTAENAGYWIGSRLVLEADAERSPGLFKESAPKYSSPFLPEFKITVVKKPRAN